MVKNSVQGARPSGQKVDPRRGCQAKNRVPAGGIQWFLRNDVVNSCTGQRRVARRTSLRPLLLIIRIEEELLLLLLLLLLLILFYAITITTTTTTTIDSMINTQLCEFDVHM